MVGSSRAAVIPPAPAELAISGRLGQGDSPTGRRSAGGEGGRARAEADSAALEVQRTARLAGSNRKEAAYQAPVFWTFLPLFCVSEL